MSAATPGKVAHKVVLAFARRSDPQTVGAAGPYLIRSVQYDTDTDYVGVD